MPIEKTNKPESGEVVAARGEDIYKVYNYTNVAVNPNDFFGDNNKKSIVDMIREMNAVDPRLWGMVATRKLAILKKPREIIGDSPEADFTREVFSNIKNFHQKLKAIMSAYDVGFSIGEIIWDTGQGSKWVIADILDRFQGKFVFGAKEWELRLLTDTNSYEGIDLKEKETHKWLVYSHDEQYGNRYGQSIYERVYWYWFLKRHASEFWNIFIERLASPVTIAKKTGILSTDENETINDFVKKLRAHTGIIIPDSVTIEFLQASQSGVKTYEEFVDYLDKGMAIAILGQTSSINNNQVGSYARDRVLDDLRQDICDFDILGLESIINDYLIKPLVDFNFANVKEYPKWRIVNDDKVDLLNFANAMKIIRDAGHEKIPISFINKNMGIPEVTEEDTEVLKPPAQPQPFGFGANPGLGQFSDIIMYAEKMAAAQKTYKEELMKLRSK